MMTNVQPTSQELAAALRAINWIMDAQSYLPATQVANVLQSLKESQAKAQYDEVGQYLAAIQEADEKDMKKPAKFVSQEGDPHWEFSRLQEESIKLHNDI